jgi:hypothetical protein
MNRGSTVDVSWFCLLGQYDFAVWTMHFPNMSKRPTNVFICWSFTHRNLSDILLRLMEAHGEVCFFTQCILFATAGICLKIEDSSESLQERFFYMGHLHIKTYAALFREGITST